jgi:hypothetical protein
VFEEFAGPTVQLIHEIGLLHQFEEQIELAALCIANNVLYYQDIREALTNSR